MTRGKGPSSRGWLLSSCLTLRGDLSSQTRSLCTQLWRDRVCGDTHVGDLIYRSYTVIFWLLRKIPFNWCNQCSYLGDDRILLFSAKYSINRILSLYLSIKALRACISHIKYSYMYISYICLYRISIHESRSVNIPAFQQRLTTCSSNERPLTSSAQRKLNTCNVGSQ